MPSSLGGWDKFDIILYISTIILCIYIHYILFPIASSSLSGWRFFGRGLPCIIYYILYIISYYIFYYIIFYALYFSLYYFFTILYYILEFYFLWEILFSCSDIFTNLFWKGSIARQNTRSKLDRSLSILKICWIVNLQGWQVLLLFALIVINL